MSAKIKSVWDGALLGDGCWEWQRSRYPNGYGQLVRLPEQYAHRIAYAEYYGPFDRSLQVLHHCDNPPCIRPDHLFLGTVRDNVQDRNSKGRNPKTFVKYGGWCEKGIHYRDEPGRCKQCKAEYDRQRNLRA